MSAPPPYSYIEGPNGRLAYDRREGAGPGVVWLGGFRSDMTGTKATHLDGWAGSAERAFLRFDYSGHGASDGRFTDGAISIWAADACFALDRLTSGPQILVGSSMGAWIATLLALARPERIAGLVYVAPAPDFTEELWRGLTAAERAKLHDEGQIERASDDGRSPDIITRRLIEDGRKNLVLDRALAIACPARILQGMRDAVVPWANAVRLAEALGSDDLVVTLVKGGDHRLSAPEDLIRLVAAVLDVSAGNNASPRGGNRSSCAAPRRIVTDVT